jgi:predicted phosphodiesterase
MTTPTYFVGDLHADFTVLYELAKYAEPSTAILVGDRELVMPMRETLAPLFDNGWDVRWVFGNHDTDTTSQADYLLRSHPEGDLHCRVATIGGLRIAGLSGTFKGRIWEPDGPVHYRTRADWLARNPQRWRGGLPVHLTATIFPEDLDTLASMKADVLVCHEGPSSCLKGGRQVLDKVAYAMGASLIIHGHHHWNSLSTLGNGVKVKSLGKHEIWPLYKDDFEEFIRL